VIRVAGSAESPGHIVVGRERELGLLRTLLTGSATGTLRGAVVEGEAGIGKSALLRGLRVEALALGFRIITGVAQELERNRAFGVIVELARGQVQEDPDSVFGDLLRLCTAEVAPGGDGGFAVTEELVTCVEACAVHTPVLLCLEDLHWADFSTIAAVNALVKRLSYLPLVIAVTMRPSPRSREVDQLVEQLTAAGMELLRLTPLSEDAAVEIAIHMLGVPPGPLLREQIATAAGNPLFVVELLRALQQQDLISTTEDAAEVAHRLVPTDLRKTLLRRYGFLGAETLRLLRMASLLGPTFSMSELAVVCQSRPTQLMDQLYEAISAGLVEESGTNLAFHHDLFRQVLYEDMPVAMRTALHREAGATLAESQASVVRVAEQLLNGDPNGEQTIEWLWRAARESAGRSASLAVRWYERTLEAMDAFDPRKVALISELVPQLVLLGRVAEAQAVATEAVHDADKPSVAVRLRVIMAHALTRQGLWTDAKEQLALAIGQYDDPSMSAVISAPDSFLGLITGDVAAAVAMAERSEGAAETADNRLAVATCLMTRTLGASAKGATEEAIVLGGRCLALSERLRTSFREFLLPELCLGVAYADADRMAEAEQSYRRGFDRATRVGAAGVLPYLQANLAILRMHTGVWEDSGSEAEACLALARSTGTRWTLHALAIMIRLSISRSEFRAAARWLVDAEAELRACGNIMGANWVLWAKALLLEAEGHEQAAAEVAVMAWDILPELRFLHTNWMFPVDLLRITLGMGNLAKANEIADETMAASARFDTASATGAALRCRALLDDDADLALAAVAAYDDAPRPVERALAQAQAAVSLANAGHPSKARQHFRTSAETFAAHGLHHEENRVNAAMRSHGLHRGRKRETRPTTGWLSLTATELSVAGLVAQGLSNPQIAARLFISRYTVETHLKHIFGKLGITSRTMLTNEVVQHSAS
jgi:DNA-binding CsgD family transcriptional regulator